LRGGDVQRLGHGTGGAVEREGEKQKESQGLSIKENTSSPLIKPVCGQIRRKKLLNIPSEFHCFAVKGIKESAVGFKWGVKLILSQTYAQTGVQLSVRKQVEETGEIDTPMFPHPHRALNLEKEDEGKGSRGDGDFRCLFVRLVADRSVGGEGYEEKGS